LEPIRQTRPDDPGDESEGAIAMNASIRKHLAAAVALASAVTVATPAYAASQGSVGATSTGTADVSVGVSDRVRISNLNDMALTFAGTGDVVGTDTFCVYRNGTGSYDIELSSANAGSASEFRASDGAGTFVDYVVTFDDDDTPADGVDTTSGTPRCR
jgi:hypothetical protein